MAGQLGRKMLLKLGDGEPSETFTAIGTLTSRSFSLNNAAIDNTADDSVDGNDVLWRETLRGISSVALSGDLRIKDHASETDLWTLAFAADNLANFQVVIPTVGVIEGPFRVTALEFSGETEGDLTGSISLESAGACSFTAE